MDLVDNERVSGENVAILEPPTGDPRRHDDDVPRRCLRRGFTLAIHHADSELAAQDFFGNRADGERLSRSRPGDDAESAATTRQLAHARPMLSLEIRLEVQRQ